MTTNTNAALREFAEGRIQHLNRGQCPDIVSGHDSRDPDCPVCAAITTAAAVPPEGWVMVPVEPTEEMLDAGSKKLGALYGHEGAKHCWHAQLAAAPKAEPLNLKCKATQKRLATLWGFVHPGSQRTATSAVAGPSKAVAYLDIGSGGYLDIGTDLDDEELRKLPSGRHMLAIVGTFGVDGYTPAAVAGLSLEQLLRGARHRIANLSRASVPFEDPLDGPILKALDAALADPPTAHAAPQPAPIFGDEDHVLVPRGLLGAACSAIDKKRDGVKTLADLRRYTTGDLSKAAPQQDDQKPYAYAVYFPDQPTVELVHDLDELTDDLTNREHQITKLYAAPQAAPAAQGDVLESEYQRGYRQGYEQRDAEVRGALV